MNCTENKSESLTMLYPTKRVGWVDWAKIVGIWLVVLAHMKNSEFVTNFIYSFHIPLFFFVSGFLAKPQSPQKTLKAGVRKLLIPYFTFFLITWIWWFFIAYLRFPNQFDHHQPIREVLIKPLLGMFFGVGYSSTYSTMVNIPIWFLMGLFSTTILYSLINKLHKKTIILSAVLLMALLSFLLSALNINLPFSLDSALMAMPFYATGHLLRERVLILSSGKLSLRKAVCLGIIMIVSLILMLSTVRVTGRIDINMLHFGNYPLISYFNAYMGIVMVVTLGVLLSQLLHNQVVVTVANGTMLIMGFERIISGSFSFAFKHFNIEPGIEVNALRAILVIAVCFPLILLAEKQFPFLLGRRHASTLK